MAGAAGEQPAKDDLLRGRDEEEQRDIRKMVREFIKKQDERKLTEWHEGSKVFAGQIHERRCSTSSAGAACSC